MNPFTIVKYVFTTDGTFLSTRCDMCYRLTTDIIGYHDSSSLIYVCNRCDVSVHKMNMISVWYMSDNVTAIYFTNEYCLGRSYMEKL